MKASQIKKALDTCIESKRPAFIWGPPGVGKSQVIRQVAEERGAQFKDVRALLLDPVDLRGLPYINGDGRSHWATPEFLPKDGNGIILWDELNAAPSLVQASLYQLILDNKCGEYSMPDTWYQVAAGNRETDRAVTSRMPSALANRFVHLNFEVDLDEWVSWALASGVHTMVISFLRFRPGLLHSFDPARNTEKAFPTPRSWEFVSNILTNRPSPEIEYELFQGTVGEGAAAEFVGFLKIARELPNPDVILMNPDAAPVPEDPAALYAICGALSHRASDQTIDRLIKYANRLPDEFSVLMVRDCVKNVPEVASSRAFIEWASKHKEVLI